MAGGGDDGDDLEIIELESVEVVEPRRLNRTARRPWRTAAAIAVAAALFGVGVLARPSMRPDIPGDDPVPRTAPPLWPFRGPLLLGPDNSSTLLASWGDIGFGFAFVYADGRVISYREGGAVTERHLSPRGLKLVRAGQLAAKHTAVSADQRRELWVQPRARIYEPSKYAVCNIASDALDATASVPPMLQAVLAGKERTLYDPNLGTRNWPARREHPPPPMNCFELTSTEASTLEQIAASNPGIRYESWPILPHGQPVAFGSPSYVGTASA